MRNSKGSLFIVSAPSGAGKTTLIKRLIEETGGLALAVSHTTRKPRPGEVEGRDYHFVGRAEFMGMRDRGEFVEWAEVHGNFYGTSRGMLQSIMSTGADVLHDIDVQGARQIRESGMPAVFIFILPPSLRVLEERLRGRESDSEEIVRRRLANAADEVKGYFIYDYVILNDTLEQALKDLSAIVTTRRLRTETVDNAWVSRNFLAELDG